MALKNCPECKSLVSNEATTCPHCGYKLKKKMGCLSWIGIIILIIISLVIIELATQKNGSESSRNYTNEAWYKGGNLHNASIYKWRGATYKNKLATSGDFVVIALGGSTYCAANYTLDEIKIKAIELESCISEVCKEKEGESIPSSTSWKISDIATVCLLQLRYDPNWVNRK